MQGVLLERPATLILSLFYGGYGGEDIAEGRFPIGTDVAAPVDQVRRDLVYPDGCDPLRRLEFRHELSDEIGIVAGEEALGHCFSDGCGGVGFIDRMKLSVDLGWCCERSHAREVGMEV